MGTPARLIEGYRAFREGSYEEKRTLYQNLALGQAPKAMVVSCCDSRVEPVAIFNAQPGELFVVRNVANLVPPFDPKGDHHGTSAAIEFAVNGLNVNTVLVLGHAGCGGIHAYLQGEIGKSSGDVFISKWMSIMDKAVAKLPALEATGSLEERQTVLEHAAVLGSLDNLAHFPFVADRVAKGQLDLVGAHFDIASGSMLWADQTDRQFRKLS